MSFSWAQTPSLTANDYAASLEDVIHSIYLSVLDYESVHEEEVWDNLLELAEHPIDINTATEEDLRQLYFLSEQQIHDILQLAIRMPLQSVYELRLLPSLTDYELRDLLPFVCVRPYVETTQLHAREVFHYAQHDILLRMDARDIESHPLPDSDPFYLSGRYTFHYKDNIRAGLRITRPTDTPARDLQYGAYIRLRDIGRIKTLVAGNYQAGFGCGLVLAPTFHSGKSAYVLGAATTASGIKHYGGTDNASMHGIATTIRAHRYLDVSALYSMTAPNDSIYRHTLGMNMHLRYQNMSLDLTMLENLYTDSLRYYYEHAAYNQHYFRGTRQAVIGTALRWNLGIVQLFTELSTAQNRQWGYAAIAGMHINPWHDIGFSLLYRYYSPWYDNTWGYAYSETSRINDENGLYIATDIRRLKNWRFSAYADVFRFDGVKYGIPFSPSWGYDLLLETQYRPSHDWCLNWRVRVKEKAKQEHYNTRLSLSYQHRAWRLNTYIEAVCRRDSLHRLSAGMLVAQDLEYHFPNQPMVLQARLQGFDVRQWDNRLYLYEHDVLYAYSSTPTYGVGGRLTINYRYQICPQLGLYLKLAETLYTKQWAEDHHRPSTRTDIHLLMRVTL